MTFFVSTSHQNQIKLILQNALKVPVGDSFRADLFIHFIGFSIQAADLIFGEQAPFDDEICNDSVSCVQCPTLFFFDEIVQVFLLLILLTEGNSQRACEAP